MRVALYVRVSTDGQVQDGFSIDAQIEQLKKFSVSEKYSVVEIYKDEGISGKNIKNRPGFKRMMKDAENNLFDKLLIWNISRLSRDYVDSVLTCKILKEDYGIIVHSVSDNTEYSNPSNQLSMHIQSSVAQFGRSKIIENVKLGMNQRAKEGKWNGGRMLGYKSVNKRLVIVEDEAKIVRKIFSLYVSGKGYKATAHQLTLAGYKTKNGKSFSTGSVRTIIINNVYAGYIKYNSEKGKNSEPIIVEGKHEAIIEKEIWERAKAINKMKSKKSSRIHDGEFLLTGILKCPECGHGMVSQRNKNTNGTYIRYYICGQCHNKCAAVCKSNLVRADYAEEYVLDHMSLYLKTPANVKKLCDILNAKINDRSNPHQEELSVVKNRIKKARNDSDKYLELYLSFDKPPSTVKNMIESLSLEIGNLEEHEKELEFELSKPTMGEVGFEELSSLMKSFKAITRKSNLKLLKEFYHSIISSVTVNCGNNPTERTVKDIELRFDRSLKGDFVPTYDTVHRV